jgi:threonine dehydratase
MHAMQPGAEISRERIASTAELIRPYIRRTPVIDIDAADFGLTPNRLTLKLELLQHSGSFKARGAFANLLMREVPPVGVAAASGGNHGAAVAYAAMRLGKKATIFLPSIASPAKTRRIRDYGAELVIAGEHIADAIAACKDWVGTSHALPVHPFDQEETMLGQGTLAQELASQAADLDTVLVAIGGGGLIGGIASWYEGKIRIVGVEPEAAPTLTRALAAGHPVDAEAGGIAADSLAPRRVGARNLSIAQRHVDRVVLITDAAIRDAQQALWKTLRIVAEPGGAAAFAALLSGRYQPAPGERVGIVLSGGNTVAVDFARQES